MEYIQSLNSFLTIAFPMFSINACHKCFLYKVLCLLCPKTFVLHLGLMTSNCHQCGKMLQLFQFHSHLCDLIIFLKSTPYPGCQRSDCEGSHFKCATKTTFHSGNTWFKTFKLKNYPFSEAPGRQLSHGIPCLSQTI